MQTLTGGRRVLLVLACVRSAPIDSGNLLFVIVATISKAFGCDCFYFCFLDCDACAANTPRGVKVSCIHYVRRTYPMPATPLAHHYYTLFFILWFDFDFWRILIVVLVACVRVNAWQLFVGFCACADTRNIFSSVWYFSFGNSPIEFEELRSAMHAQELKRSRQGAWGVRLLSLPRFLFKCMQYFIWKLENEVIRKSFWRVQWSVWNMGLLFAKRSGLWRAWLLWTDNGLTEA